jgi:hypothetical protein
MPEDFFFFKESSKKTKVVAMYEIQGKVKASLINLYTCPKHSGKGNLGTGNRKRKSESGFFIFYF